jgi:hypothetical protein
MWPGKSEQSRDDPIFSSILGQECMVLYRPNNLSVYIVLAESRGSFDLKDRKNIGIGKV